MAAGRKNSAPPTTADRTTIEVDRATSDLLGTLVGRFGKTKGDVARAGAECLLAKLTPSPSEAHR